jgi:hypothetical protein
MSATDRQNRLLVAEDWKRIYQSFQNADFQSYDFENLRRVMIGYIRENYPEDFNDYIESSEYLALIDLIAFLGQSFAFRVDLNARENFLDLAERRESVLRLARLLSYKVKRNIAASGLLKFNTVTTTENIIDSNGRNLAGQVIGWNDPSNSDWYDQFVRIINASLPELRKFGNPDDKDFVLGVPTEQYRFQTLPTALPIFKFNKTIDGRSMDFEIVSTAFENGNAIVEEPPKIGNQLAFLYRDDGKGNGSSNTGFFLHFKQGNIAQGRFSIAQPSTDETVDIDAVNINNSDIWLYRLDKNGQEDEYWTQVPNFEGNNVIFNSLNKSIKNLYGVVTRTDDQASLLFSDGVFGNLPQGIFRVYYRVSNGLRYTINPRDIRNVTIDVPYTGNLGQQERLTISLSLQSSVTNSSPAEENSSIKARAPATYYTQNRMITAEDYNISPLSVNQEVVKIKAINRTSSGISRYFDLVDPTGKYSKTNLFADDGVLYKETYQDSFRFKFRSRTEIEAVIYNQIFPLLSSKNLKNFYYNNFAKIPAALIGAFWYNRTIDTNQVTGYLRDANNLILKVGIFSSTLLKYFTIGSLVRYDAPAGYYFDKNKSNKISALNGRLIETIPNASTTLWTKVISVAGDGTNAGTGILVDGTGPIILNDIIPDPYNNVATLAPRLTEIIPAWRDVLESTTIASMIDLIFGNKAFGLRYDIDTRTWKIITETNLNVVDSFNLGRQGDVTNQNVDSSWLILFTSDTEFYTVASRLERFIFESDQQIRFFFDSSDKVFDVRNNQTVKDKIKVLNVNAIPGSNYSFNFDKDWEITDQFVGLDGYVDTKKIQVTFNDIDDDGVVDDPTLFTQIVSPEDDTIAVESRYIIQEKYEISQGQEDYRYVENNGKVLIFNNELEINVNNYNNGQYFYFIDTKTVKQFNTSTGLLHTTLDYRVFSGRDKLRFQYIHNADYESRIDPGLTNIIDLFVLTKQYDINFRQWLNGSLSTEPLPLSTDGLSNIMSVELNKIKTVSDEVIYHPVKYKVLFGSKANADVQATFKVIKNSEVVISDNDVKSRVLSAITEFFNLENWEFGDNFYFSELSAYVMKELSPNIVNFVIVPKQDSLKFGSLFEIRSEKDQIFINGAGIDDIEIISAITATKINSSGTIDNNTQLLNAQFINSTGRY